MKFFNRILFFLFTFILSHSSFAQKGGLNIFGEDWSKITYLVDRSPSFDISNIKTVIISEVVNSQNVVDNHCIDMYDELANNITDIDGLTLVDRSKTQSLLKEFKFQQASGLVNDKQIRKLGDFYGSGLIIFGRIQIDQFSQNVKKSGSLFSGSSGCKGSSKREGVYRLDINFKIIDLKTASILFSKTLKSKIERSGPSYDGCQVPADLNSTEFYQYAKEDIGIQFKELFVTHQKEYEIDFQTNRKINDELKVAINYLEIDDFESGYMRIKEIAQKASDGKAKSAALYNLAKMQLYNGETEDSLKNAKEAYMLNPKNNDCLIIINELK